MAGTITTVVKAIFQSEGADKVAADIRKVGQAGEEISKKQTRLGNESTNTGRAFASQASGLGGLVAAYAGAAATIFALQQAFAALKSIAEFEQIITGTRQLAATLGQSGDTIIGNIKNITKGQLSLKEAATVANLALSSGFNTDQISKLTLISTNASKVLGRDLTDSFTRLVRGAAKLEPELLDELGIFTRIEPAVAAYASKIGRAASSLTDAERRQAFLNAVIEEGTRKYGNISTSTETSAEAFNRLAATLADLGNKLGGFIVDILAPIANFFSKDLGNALALFLGILAITLGKARSLLVDFFRDTSLKVADYGSTVAKRIAGPGLDQALGSLSKKFEDISLVGFNKAEKAYIKAIKEGTLAPQQIGGAIQALSGFESRKASLPEPPSERGKATQAAQIAAVKEALKDLPAIQTAAGSAAVKTGQSFEVLSIGISKVSSAIGTIISRFNIFIAILGALQFLVQVVFGVDILAKITDFFTSLREGGQLFTQTIDNIVFAASKKVRLELSVTVSKESIDKGIQVAQDRIGRAIAGGPRGFFEAAGEFIDNPFKYVYDTAKRITDEALKAVGVFSSVSDLTNKLKEQRNKILGNTDISKEEKTAALAIIDNFINFQIQNNISDAVFKGIITGVKNAGGTAEDFFKTLKLEPQYSKLPGLTSKGEATLGTTSISLQDEKLGKIAANAILATSTIVTLNEELARGPLTASQVGEKNVAINNRILEIQKLISLERNKALKQGDLDTIEKLKAADAALTELKIEQKRVNTLTDALSKQEALVKFLETSFSTELNIGKNLDFSGILKDGKLVETELEQYTNRLGLFDKALSAVRFDEFARAARGNQIVLAATRTRIEEVRESLIELEKQQKESASLGLGEIPVSIPNISNIANDIKGAQSILQELLILEATFQEQFNSNFKATIEEYTKISNLGAILTGGIAKQALEASNLLKAEERRTIDLRNQVTILNLQIDLQKEQNKLSLLQAQGEARQRSGQAQIRVGETQLNLLKQRDQSEKLRLDILSKQQDRQESFNNALLKERTLIAEINQARVKNIKDMELAQLSLRQSVGEALPGIGTQSDRVNIDAQIALKTAELDLSNLATRRKILEDEAQTNKDNLDGRISVAQEEYDTALLRTLSFGNLEQQLKKEEELIKQRRKLEDDKLANESAILNQQTEIARRQGRLSFIQANIEGERRDYELNLIDKQISLFETQRDIFDKFIKDLRERTNAMAVIFGQMEPAQSTADLEANTAITERLNKEFSDRIARLRSSFGESRQSSAAITRGQQDIAGSIFRGIQEANEARLGGINAEIESLKRLRAVEDQIRELEVQDRRNQSQEEKKAAEDRLNLLKKERTQINNELLKNRLGLLGEENSIQAQLARSLVQAQIKTSAFVRAINDISLGIQNNLDTAVRDFFKTINEGTKTSIALSQTLKKLAVSSLETVQQSLAKAFITQPLQEAVGGFFEGLLGGLGYITPRNADTVLSNVYDPTLKALRIVPSVLAQPQQNLFSNLGTSLGSAIGSGAKSLFAPIAQLFAPTAVPTSTSPVSPNMFSEAGPSIYFPQAIGGPVRHMAAGGYAGLRDRVPTLLEPGEFVIRRPAAMAIGGDTLNQMNATGQTGPGNVTVNVSNQGTPQEVIGTPKISMNGRNMIVDIVVKDIQNNGPIRKTLRGGM